jgi:hypothetical protein
LFWRASGDDVDSLDPRLAEAGGGLVYLEPGSTRGVTAGAPFYTDWQRVEQIGANANKTRRSGKDERYG